MPPQAAANPRKRPAPGTSPATHSAAPNLQQPLSFQFSPNSPPLTDDQFLSWGQSALNGSNAAGLSNPTVDYGANTYGGFNGNALQTVSTPGTQQQHGTSTQLARRSNNQQLVARGSRMFGDGDDGWADYGDGVQLDGQVENGYANNDTNNNNDDDDDIESLERRAAIAKREAQAKRKQIPPFVQKLSSFLDESRNTDLIRWSDDGNSFIVLDEDEFARTLIPELFKHSNYASFVRQLNMYGFHKKVGLSDNSMRASERRNKSPSEYVNRYFKRGHPNLLWLINKPKNPNPSTKGTKDSKGGDEGLLGLPSGRDASVAPSDGNMGDGSGEGGKHIVPASGQSLAEVRQQLEAIQHQQRVISHAIGRLRKDHDQIYEQAAAFQALHDRHETSINAILTFLATVYNRSLEGHGGQNLANMVASAVTQDPQGPRGIAEAGHLEGSNNMNQAQRAIKKQRLLLAAPPPSVHDLQSGKANTLTPGTSVGTPGSTGHAASPTPGPQSGQAAGVQGNNGVDGFFDSLPAESPPTKTEMGEADIMTMINTANSNNSPPGGQRVDISAALTEYQNANGNSPLLTTSQRNDMLQQMMASDGQGNALIVPNTPRLLDLSRLGSSREELDLLSRLQAEQNSKVQQLASMIQPLSPTGSIPGLDDRNGIEGPGGAAAAAAAGFPGNAPGALDLDQIFNSGDYFSSSASQGQGDDLVDFDAEPGGGTNNGNPSRRQHQQQQLRTANESTTGFDFFNDDDDHDNNNDVDDDHNMALLPHQRHGLSGHDADLLTPSFSAGGGHVLGTVNNSEAASPATTIGTTITTGHNSLAGGGGGAGAGGVGMGMDDEAAAVHVVGMAGGGGGGSPGRKRRRM